MYEHRLTWLFTVLAGIGVVMVLRLFWLMVVEHGEYLAKAEEIQGVVAKMSPQRGLVYWQNSHSKEIFPVALNKDTFTVFADTRAITTPEMADSSARELAAVTGANDEEKLRYFVTLSKPDDPYEPILPKIDDALASKIADKKILGIALERHAERYYPEGELASHVVGFVGKTDKAEAIGRYGIEGYFDKVLAGSGGFVEGVRSASGRLIPVAGQAFTAVEDGADVVLTLDRTLQFMACERLKKAAILYKAESASLVMMNPQNGDILAMCNTPAFDPNNYGKVAEVSSYNNHTVFTAYEPGSVFKPVAMAAALDEGLVTPETHFYDSGIREGVCDKPIQNAGNKAYQDQTMIGVLDNSINTGMVWLAEKLGKTRLKQYVETFGFGTKTGITLDTEVAGNIESLNKNPKRDFDCYTATASFGQGITVTPIQLVSAYAAIANGGNLVLPRIVSEIRYSSGKVEKIQPQELRQVMSSRAASLLKSMLVSVVDKGHGTPAKVPGYLVAGKTGTAQIAGPGGYIENAYNHSFVGFAPAENPAFVMIIKFEKPAVEYSASTAAPVFGDIAKFALQYLQIPPTR